MTLGVTHSQSYSNLDLWDSCPLVVDLGSIGVSVHAREVQEENPTDHSASPATAREYDALGQ